MDNPIHLHIYNKQLLSVDTRKEAKITLLFFQNCVSPHQMPYIRECVEDARVAEVYLIVPRVDYDERKSMGWESDDLVADTGVQFVLKPSDEQVVDLIQSSESPYCIFSGIRGDADVFGWLRLSIGYDARRYIVTEPPYTFDKPLWMHYMRFMLQDYRYVKHIDGVFGIGDDAVKYYSTFSKRWRVYPFQYVTEQVERTIPPVESGDMRLLYVGSLSTRKNVGVVVDALEGCRSVSFTLIGDGEEREALERTAMAHGIEVAFLGMKQMAEIPALMQQYDVLVLPSLHDGWGAVVNEAITLGLYVVVSDRCGAKAMIRDAADGLIFKSGDVGSLRGCIAKCVDDLSLIRSNVSRRVADAQRIGGASVAKYFIDSLLTK